MNDERDILREERIIYAGLLLAGALPVAGWLVRGGAPGAGITLCVLLVASGFLGLVSSLRTVRRHLPRATLRP